MKKMMVKDLMVPLSEYATVTEDATLEEAIISLEKAQDAYGSSKYLHRAVLVLDKSNHVVGKVSQLDALMALEPKYSDIQAESGKVTFRHFSRMFLRSMVKSYHLFDKPLDVLQKKAAHIRVRDFMHKPTEEEHLDADATLDEAIHMLIMGHHQSLLVTRGERIVGILRLTDVFAAVFQSMSDDPGKKPTNP
ncbi:MAG: CBS domain-containing protein [Desulfobacteraceae bacterium]|nr:MAG: CBS domain-containing protein [Desulfobacteraceae bacterium]